MAERPGREFAALLGLAAFGLILPSSVFVLLGSGQALQASLALIGALGSCYDLVGLAAKAPAPSLIAALVLFSSIAIALRSGLRQALQTRRGVRPLAAFARRSSRLQATARLVGIAPELVSEVVATTETSFCHGLIRPRIIVTSALTERLTDDELAAVLAHEAQHLRSFDPARMLAARAAAAGFFWLPLTRELCERYLVAKELAADRTAVSLIGARPFCSALLKVAAPAPAGTASFGAGSLERRVEAILGGSAAPAPLSGKRVGLTLASSLAATALVVWAWTIPTAPTAPSGVEAMVHSSSVHGFVGMGLLAALNLALFCALSRVATRLRRRCWHMPAER
jgi:Zn-dependent protease with chaperone function